METLDAVVYDIQDLGTRFYTFISTLLYVMEDCAAAGRELIVLDRPAPLDGVTVEGGLLEPEYRSFVGAYPLCIRYGLTAGELACMVNAEQKLGCRLTVVPCTGWERTRLFSETGNLWMMPSMGIPHFSTALVYPGTCLFEGTNVSEGRGTACPFEMIGAPFVDGAALAGAMNREGLPGVIFTAACFTPYASKHKGEPCEGVLLHVSDAHAFRPVRTGVTLLYRIREMWPRQFRWKPRGMGSRGASSACWRAAARSRTSRLHRKRCLRHGKRTAPLLHGARRHIIFTNKTGGIQMDDGEQIGQRLVTGFPGTELTEDFRRMVREYKISNVICSGRTLRIRPAQLKQLCGEIQALVRRETGHGAFITADQEGGLVTRLPGNVVTCRALWPSPPRETRKTPTAPGF